MIYADLDMDRGVYAKSFIDCVGQYSRPDILSLTVDASRREHVRYMQDKPVAVGDKDGKDC